MMTKERAIEVLKRRMECGKADTIKCIQTGCENCDLFYKEKNLAEASAIAFKAIEKQIPKKPVIKLHTNRVPDEQEECYCPCCDEWLTWEYTHFKCCYNCGQRIDWSEVEE